MIVQKALKMAQMMDVPVLGLVENMAYTTCPCCGEKIYPFGEGRTAEVAAANGVPLLASLPINPAFAAACDKGEIEKLEVTDIQTALEVVEAIG